MPARALGACRGSRRRLRSPARGRSCAAPRRAGGSARSASAPTRRGSRPGRRSLSCTTTYGTRARLQISTKSGRFDLPPHSTIEICSRSASWPSAWNTNGSAIFSVIPSTRIAAREKKSSARSASNSHITRNASSTSIGRSRSTAVTPSSSRVTRLTSSSAATLSRPGACVVKKTWLPRSASRWMSAVEVAVRLRGEEQLRLLDREDDALGLGRAGLEPAHEGDARRGRPRERLADRRVHRLRGRESPPLPRRGSPPRSAAGKWTIGGAPSRSSSEIVRPSASVASIESRASPDRHVGRREVEAGIEQGAQGEEQRSTCRRPARR